MVTNKSISVSFLKLYNIITNENKSHGMLYQNHFSFSDVLFSNSYSSHRLLNVISSGKFTSSFLSLVYLSTGLTPLNFDPTR